MTKAPFAKPHIPVPRHGVAMPASRSVLEAQRAYEESLADVQRHHRRLLTARGADRLVAAQEYERALARARELAARVTHGHAA